MTEKQEREAALADQLDSMDYRTETSEMPESQEEPRELGKAKFFGNRGGQRDEGEKTETPSVRTGWLEVDRSEFEERGQFYPSDWKFFIKPATVSDIKNYSSIDEDRPEQVQECINEMLRSNIKITNEEGNVPWGKLNDWDRLFMLLKIREYTFVKGEREISFNEPCESCGEDITFELKSSNLKYNLPDQDLINTYYNPETRTWEVDPQEYGVNGPIITFHVPTVDVDKVVFKYAMDKARESQRKSANNTVKVDETFIKFLPWMLSRVTRDDKVNEKFIRDAETIYRSWGMDMFGLAEEILDKIAVTQEDRLRTICPHCGEEVTALVQFRDGLRSLFAVSGGRKKFGEK